MTGTFAGVVPVTEVDGRDLTEGRSPMVERLQGLYKALDGPGCGEHDVGSSDCDVVWTAQYLDRNDAQFRGKSRLRGL